MNNFSILKKAIYKIHQYLSIPMFLFLSIIISGCQNMFDFSPYEIRVVDGKKNTTLKNLVDIENNIYASDSITLAVTADPHYNYNYLLKVVNSINKNYQIDFALCLGDISDSGIQTEFELFHSEMDKLGVPYITTIGNHDYRSNGEDVYTQMFGHLNYSLKAGFLRIIVFDDIFWESNKDPDFDWLESELKRYQGEIILVAAHIPPDTDQFNEAARERYYKLMQKYGVRYSFHGHQHNFEVKESNGTLYLNTGAIMKGKYTLVTIFKNSEIRIKEISV